MKTRHNIPMNFNKLTVIIIFLVSILYMINYANGEKKIPIIPDNIFQKGKVLLEPCSYEIFGKKKKYMIQWEAPFIDGTYILVIHPEQIFLRSSHENPNPDHLYWMTNIDHKQYIDISKYLDQEKHEYLVSHKKRGYWIWGNYIVYYFAKRVNEIPLDYKWTDQKIKLHEEDAWAKLHTNLSLLIWEFNQNLQPGTRSLPYLNDRFVVDKKRVLIKENNKEDK